MKFTCNRALINDALQLVCAVVDPRHIKELLHCVRLEVQKDAVTLSTTDLEVGMRYTLTDARIEEPGDLVLNAAQVSSIVREASCEELSFVSEDVSCVIEGSDCRYHVLAGQSTEFPDIPQFPGKEGVEMEGAVVREMIRMTAFAAAPEKQRYALNGLFLTMKEKSNQVMLVATDGRRLAQIQRKASKKSGIAAEVIIPTKAALQMERMASDTGLMRLHVDDRHLYAKTAEAEMVAQLIDGVFPNFRDAIPKDVDKKVDIAADALASAVRRASLLRDPHGDTPSVTFRLHDNRLTLSSAAPNAGDAKIELEVAYGGPEVSIVLNPDYLTEGLKSLGANVITMEIADAATPCLMRYGKDYLYLTMPIT